MNALIVAGLVLVTGCSGGSTSPPRGTISGTVGYPSEEVPPMRVYAIADGGQSHYSVTTSARQATFTIDGVPAGRYIVVAYPRTADATGAGGWSKFVECGMSVDCKDHSLIPVVVTAGQAVTSIKVADWYADAGTFPLEPR